MGDFARRGFTRWVSFETFQGCLPAPTFCSCRAGPRECARHHGVQASGCVPLVSTASGALGVAGIDFLEHASVTRKLSDGNSPSWPATRRCWPPCRPAARSAANSSRGIPPLKRYFVATSRQPWPGGIGLASRARFDFDTRAVVALPRRIRPEPRADSCGHDEGDVDHGVGGERRVRSDESRDIPALPRWPEETRRRRPSTAASCWVRYLRLRILIRSPVVLGV